MRVPLDVTVRARSGRVREGVSLYVYDRGTTDEALGYTTVGGATQLTYPLVSDEEGRFPDAFFPGGHYDLYSPDDEFNPTQAWEAVVGTDSADFAVTLEAPVNPRHSTYGAAGDGSTDDTAAIQAAIDAAKAVAGELYVPPGDYACDSPLDLDDIYGLRISGGGGPAGGGLLDNAARFKFTGTGSGNFLSIKSSHGVIIDGLEIRYSSDSFTGHLIEFGHSLAGADSNRCAIEKCYIGGMPGGGAPGNDSAESLVLMNYAINSTLRECSFNKAQNGVVGRLDGVPYSVANKIDNCDFLFCEEYSVLNPGEAWVIQNSSFENQSEGKLSGIGWDGVLNSLALTITGCWFGDVSAPSGRSWIDIGQCVGLTIMGNRFATAGVGGNAIQLMGDTGVSITGNWIEGPTGIKFLPGFGNSNGVFVAGNDLSFCDDPYEDIDNCFGLVRLANRDEENVIPFKGDVVVGSPAVYGDKLAFFGEEAVVRPAGVPVTAQGIHDALVELGLIEA